jgi:hypothetical protein
MTEEIFFDVILLSTGNFHANLEAFQKHRPPEEDFYLNEQMWVGSLPKGISSKLVFDACDSPGWHLHPARRYGMRHAFCRKVEPAYEDYYHWDQDQFIGTAILLSRFIRPTTIGTSLAARLYFTNGEPKDHRSRTDAGELFSCMGCCRRYPRAGLDSRPVFR